MKVTDKEFAVLTAIALNEYSECNGHMPENHTQAGCWSDTLDCCVQVDGYPLSGAKGFGGVIASLKGKGLANGNGESVEHTEEGFRVWKELYEARTAAQAV